MRALFTLLIALVLIVVILVGGAFALIYFTLFNVTPAEYPFLNDASQIVSIEYAKFTYGDEGLVPEKVGVIVQTENFFNELSQTTDCHTGISLDNLKTLIDGKPIEGVVINYADGSFDFITPYLCVNSNYNPKGAMDLLNTKIYGFDEEQFALILDKYVYAIELPEDFDGDFDNLPDDFDGNLDDIPDGLIPGDLVPQS